MKRSISKHISGHRRRGGIYVAVLGVSLLVMVIGLSAVAAVRIENRTSRGAVETVKARLGAQSAGELALYRISTDSNWRSTYTHNVWSPVITIGGIDHYFKFVDQVDTDLANDPLHGVRMYAKAIVGDAVRVTSVMLNPQTVPNLLKNGDMESGLSGWDCTGWAAAAYCDLNHTGGDPHLGNKSTEVKNRDADWTGITQDVTNTIAGDTTYYVESWLKMKDSADWARVCLYVKSTGSGTARFSTGWTVVGTTWTLASGTMTPTWSGELSAAHLYIETAVTNQNFFADDVVLVEGNNAVDGQFAIVPGTWRREPAD